jgi:hypothetical protein
MALMRFVLSAVALALVVPQEPAVPNVVIDHKQVDCVLAGQPPLLNACFTPPEEIVRARVYYRLGEAAWQFAPLVPEGSCFGAVLPRPTRNDGTLRYYLEAVDLASQSTKSSEYRALVVQDPNACAGVMAAVKPGPTQVASAGSKKKTLPFILIGAGAAGAGVALAAGGGDSATTTFTLTASLPATVSSTIISSSSTTPESTSTTVPGSSTTTTPGSSSTTLGPATTTTTLPGSTTTTTLPGTTTTTTTLPGTTTTTTSTTVATTSTTMAPTTTTQPCTYGVTPSTEGFGLLGGTGSLTVTTAASCAWNLSSSQPAWLHPSQTSGSGTRVVNYVVDGLVVGSRNGDIYVDQSPSAAVHVTQSAGGGLQNAPVVWIEMAIAGGSGQIVWNGASATYAAEGTTSVQAPLGAGSNRVEALLVSADGKPGVWRFSFAPAVKGLRPLAGKADSVTPDSITFRLSGRPGERVVFAFESEP